MPARNHLKQSQNFLRDTRLVHRLIQRAALTADDRVIDIGAGKGILTKELARSAGLVLAVELDPRLVRHLQSRFRTCPNVIVFGSDVLGFPLPATPYKVFASIPYRWTAAIVAKLTSGTSPSTDSWLVVQKEAAERYVPGTTVTMVAAQLYPWFEVSIEHVFSRSDFTPHPSVDSVLMRIRQRPVPLLSIEDREAYEQMVAAIFSAWKPTVGQALREMVSGSGMRNLDTDMLGRLHVRPGSLEPELWVRLYLDLAALNDVAFWEGVSQSAQRLRAQQASIERPTQTRRGRPGRRR